MKSDEYSHSEALESIQNSGGIVGYQPGGENALEEARRGAGAGKPGKDSGDIAHPPHYQAKNDPQGIYECIKVIEAWDLGFCLGNALKYISRAGRKPGEDAKRDLGKAIWYLQREMGINRINGSNWCSETATATMVAAQSQQWKDKFVLADAERDGLEMAVAILTADRDAWKKRAEELQGEADIWQDVYQTPETAPAAESVTDFDKTCPEVKPGQVWQDGPEVCGRHEYIINEKTLGKVNGRWQNGVTYYRSDQFGPRLFWREIEDFHSDFQFVREEQ